MKKLYRILGLFFATAVMCGCGSKFLDTDYPTGVDVDNGLNNVNNIETATNGVYYRLFNYRFAGNYAISIGDFSADMTAFVDGTSHFNSIFKYDVTPNDIYLEGIWNWGYKTVDNAARVIKASNQIMDEQSDDDQERLKLCIAQASALKGLATLYLTNIFALPIKVNGTDNGSTLGVVAVEEPIQAFQQIERATVAQCYQLIIDDFQRAIDLFEELGYDSGDTNYLGLAAVEGLMARTLLYMEDYDNAKTHAQNALTLFNGSMIYTREDYRAMYASTSGNSESIFKLAINSTDSWSANSSGALWTTYGFKPNFAYTALVTGAGKDDIRDVLLENKQDGSYGGGKFYGEGGNPAIATQFMVRIPEMYLIIAECELKSANGTLANAKAALLNVAKRNLDITTVDDLPADAAGVLAFLEEERARELFQEGHRFYDLRRWGKMASVFANAGNTYTYTNYDIAKFCYPIPAAEVRSNFGVVQTNNWNSFLPR